MSYSKSGVANIGCDECGAEFEVIPADDTFRDVSFCPFCGSEVVLDEESVFEEDDE